MRIDSRILVCGLIRNCANSIFQDLEIFTKSFSGFSNVEFCLVESDSTDQTIEVIQELGDRGFKIELISLGLLEENIPDRIERLRYCRNIYVEYIRENAHKYDYVAVADFDRINRKLKSKAIESCFGVNFHWDMCSANQTNGYYDVYALRAPDWCEIDIFEEIQNTTATRTKREEFNTRTKVIYDRMRTIPRSNPWIPVESSFGGLAIYKKELFMNSDYSRSSKTSVVQCEHVDFHLKLIQKKYKLFINPGLINSHWNAHNINRIKLVRRIRGLRLKLSRRGQSY